MNIHTEVTGQGPDIVLLHGWSHDHRIMQPLVQLLEKNYRVTNVDLPGMGQSEWDDRVQSVNASADLLLPRLPERALYIGWSWGGAVAQSIAGRYPERVRRLVLIGSVPRFIETDNWPGVPQPGFQAIFNQNINTYDDFYDFYLQSLAGEFDGDTSSVAYQQVKAILDQKAALRVDDWRKGIYIIDEADLRPEYAKIQCPIDLILGKEDGAVQIDLQKLIALNAKTHIHQMQIGHHMPFWTHPEEFNPMLTTILDKEFKHA